jgi:hypothetical protein
LYRRVLKLLKSSHQRLAGTPLQLAARGRPSNFAYGPVGYWRITEEVIVPEIAVRKRSNLYMLARVAEYGSRAAPSGPHPPNEQSPGAYGRRWGLLTWQGRTMTFLLYKHIKQRVWRYDTWTW